MRYQKQLTGFKQKLTKIIRLAPTLVPTPDEGVKRLKFLSDDGCVAFNSFLKNIKMELKQNSVELVKPRTKVDAIGKAIDEICDYSSSLMLKKSCYLRLTKEMICSTNKLLGR